MAYLRVKSGAVRAHSIARKVAYNTGTRSLTEKRCNFGILRLTFATLVSLSVLYAMIFMR